MTRPTTVYRLCVDVDVLGQPVSWSFERLADGDRDLVVVPGLKEASGPFDTRAEALEAAWTLCREHEGLLAL